VDCLYAAWIKEVGVRLCIFELSENGVKEADGENDVLARPFVTATIMFSGVEDDSSGIILSSNCRCILSRIWLMQEGPYTAGVQ
jgi:hypothetical protein